MTAPQNDPGAAVRREAVIQTALAEGRINQFSAPRWRKMLDDDEASATALMGTLTPVQSFTTEMAAFFAGLPQTSAPAPSAALSSNDPAAVAHFRATALANAKRQEEADRVRAVEDAETDRAMRALGFEVAS